MNKGTRTKTRFFLSVEEGQKHIYFIYMEFVPVPHGVTGKEVVRKLPHDDSFPDCDKCKILEVILRVEFFMAMIPPTVTHQEKKIAGRGKKKIVYEPAELKDAREKLRAYLSRHRPDKPYTGAVRLVTKWCWPTKGKHESGEWKTTKPDTDNLIKLLKDCMAQEGFFVNDAIVVSEITEKFWADPAGIFVAIYEL